MFIVSFAICELTDGQFIVRRDEGDIVYTSQASVNHCSFIHGYCQECERGLCHCDFRRTYDSITGKCEDHYRSECDM